MIKRLYSETNLFDEVVFRAGINIILGKYSNNKGAKGVNGIGKSSVIRLIDFSFLSDGSAKLFAQGKYDFLREGEHTVSLEFEANNELYVVTRSFNDKLDILFGKKDGKQEYFSKADLKSILLNKMFPSQKGESFLKGNRFGTLMSFFIKDDLDSHKRIDPFSLSSHVAKVRDAALYYFFLLGLPNKNLMSFDTSVSEYNKKADTVKFLEKKLAEDAGQSIEKFKSEKVLVEQRVANLEQSLKDFHFLENYKDIETQLGELTISINERLKEYSILERKLNRIKDSYSILDEEIDTASVQRIYNESVSRLGDYVKKTLDEVQAFRKDLLENRKKFFAVRELEVDQAIRKILEEIADLESKRSGLYKMLDEQGAMDSVANTYEQLIKEKTGLDSNVQILNQIDEINADLATLDTRMSQIRSSIMEDLRNQEGLISSLRSLFLEILENALSLSKEELSSSYFDLSLKPKTRRGDLPFKIEISVPKTDALGQSRLKIVAFDLMVFLNAVKEDYKLPDFLIHDGVFHGVSQKTRIQTLNYIHHKFLLLPKFQYLVTFNEDEINFSDSDVGFNEMIVKTFEDSEDKMLFKRVFG